MQRVLECPTCRLQITSISQNLHAKKTIEIVLNYSDKYQRQAEVLLNLEKTNKFTSSVYYPQSTKVQAIVHKEPPKKQAKKPVQPKKATKLSESSDIVDHSFSFSSESEEEDSLRLYDDKPKKATNKVKKPVIAKKKVQKVPNRVAKANKL